MYGCVVCILFLFQAEDGIRDLVRSRGLGDVYKRQGVISSFITLSYDWSTGFIFIVLFFMGFVYVGTSMLVACLLYTSDAADERSSVDLGGRRIIKQKNNTHTHTTHNTHTNSVDSESVL